MIANPRHNMLPLLLLTSLASLHVGRAAPLDTTSAIVVQRTAPADVAAPLPEAFLSYSIEYCFFPDFAGNLSAPNTFSSNLVNNLGKIQGSNPIVRVGGNTQDRSHYVATQATSIINTFANASDDQPQDVEFGPSFFESYHTFPNTKFVHGFNLALSGNDSAVLQKVVESAVAACNAAGDKFIAYEYGNEPDLSPNRTWRPRDWDEEDTFGEWKTGTDAISKALRERCDTAKRPEQVEYFAPSFARFDFLSPLRYWEVGLQTATNLKAFVMHNYVGVSTLPGLTLQGTLMNHTYTINSLEEHRALMEELPEETAAKYILGETNSLARQGKPGISDAFGAALWNLDWSLQTASVGIRRLHMHQGTNYRYGSWQPITTERAPKGTKPAYYGNVALATFLGDLTKNSVQVAEIKLPDAEFDAGYAAYVNGEIERIAVINLRTYNQTSDTATRPERTYSFQIPDYRYSGEVIARRLTAAGSDELSGATFAGISYNYELDEGRPAPLDNVTAQDTVPVSQSGLLEITVPDASAAIIDLKPFKSWTDV